MLNPDLSRDPALEQSTYQGYDGRADGYNPSVTVSYPLTLDPSDGIKSLVSTESILSFPYNPALDDDTLHQPYTYKVVERADIGGQGILRTAAILTVVNSPPEQGSFRPPFVGVTKPTFSSQNLRTDLLPAFEPVGEVPSLSALTRLVQRPWISVQKRNYMSAGIEPVNNGIAYGRDVATVLGDAALALCSNFPLEEKRPILHGLVQMGIDTFYAVQLDSMLFENSGGYRVGRKFQVLLAGLMLNNQELLHVAGIFQEDQATYYGGDALSGEVLWTGWSSQPKPFSDILSNNVMYGTSRNWQFPGSLGNHEEHPLDQWAQVMHGNDHPWNRAEGYRRLVSWSLPGQALSALLLGLKPYWNHPAYFDYVDRWMNEDDAASRQALASAALTYGWNSIDQEADWTDPEIYRPHGRLCISNFAEAMYRRYRGYASGDPQASFTVTPRRGRAPLVTQFDASSSNQFRGSITQYSWQFGDGATASGRNVAHSYTQNGNYTATLTVIDDSTPPRVAQTTRQILVNDAVEPSLIFYLPFDNDFADRSGEDHQVSCLRDCFGHMSGRIGQAAIFGGEPFGSSRGDVYVSPSSTDLQGMSELTVAFWAKKASPTIGNASEALKKGGSYQVRVQDGAVTAILSNSSSTSFVTVPVQNLDSDWHHYAFAANGTTVRFYFDGLEVPHSARAFQSPIGIDTTRDLVIGGDGSGASFNGALDDFRIYNRALAAGEIGQLAAP
jgi:PKD repeat protein